jgi:hypothetical protein
MLVFISLVMALGLIGLALDTRLMQISYVDPGGGFEYLADITFREPLTFASTIVEFLCQFFTAGIQVNCCYSSR